MPALTKQLFNVTGIVAALPLEARCLAPFSSAKFGFQKNVALAGVGWIRVSGMGAANAAHAAAGLLQGGAQRLISWGVAGALTPGLKAGALVLPDAVVANDGREFLTDAEWRARLMRFLSDVTVAGGRLTESAKVSGTAADKHALYARTGAIAVDMESAALAAVAKSGGVPFIAIRAIVDEVDRPIPAAAMLAVNEQGNLNPVRLIRSIAADPRQLRDLLHLANSMRAAQATLKRVAALARSAL